MSQDQPGQSPPVDRPSLSLTSLRDGAVPSIPQGPGDYCGCSCFGDLDED